MSAQPILVTVDDRARLMSAVLSVTDWPAREQARKRHRAHAHARATAKWAQRLANHPAVHSLQTLLDQNTPLQAAYTYALHLSWPELRSTAVLPWAPPYWDEQLQDFYVQAELQALWDEEEAAWQRAQEEAQKALAGVDFRAFLEPFFGAVQEQFVLMPNISYPSDTEVGVRLDDTLFCLIPPRIAWGDNEPWPFDDDAAHIVRGALAQYAQLLVTAYLRLNAAALAPTTTTPLPVSDTFRRTYPTWSDQFTALFVGGTVALFLEETFGQQEARAYVLMEKRLNGLDTLPSVISVLKRYLDEHDEAHYSQLVDFLPVFGKHLRVAQRLLSD